MRAFDQVSTAVISASVTGRNPDPEQNTVLQPMSVQVS